MVFFLYRVILNLQSRFEKHTSKGNNTMLDENIRIMRREKGLTQEQLAEVMGVSTASVSKWETGVAAPELGMLAALADYFEMSIDALIGHTVGRAQLKEQIAKIEELSLANEDEKAMEQAEELLRRYPNEYDVVACTSGAYYTAFIHNRETEYIHRCMELIHRKYTLSKDSSGKKWFEMQKELPVTSHLPLWKRKQETQSLQRAISAGPFVQSWAKTLQETTPNYFYRQKSHTRSFTPPLKAARWCSCLLPWVKKNSLL